MTELKDMKIRIESPTHCAHIQDALFAEGYSWQTAAPKSHYDPCTRTGKWIFANYDGTLTWDHDADYGQGHTHEEYVWTPQKKFVKRADYYKQPETKPLTLTKYGLKQGEAYIWKTTSDGNGITFFQTGEQIIAKQKTVADKVLDKLFSIDPFAICAGGAPRDWHFGKPATDLDIFFHTGVEQLTIVAEMLRHVGIDIDEGQAHLADDLPEWYKLNPALKCVFSIVVEDVNVQIMLMNDKTHNSVVPHFPFSICKVWYKHGTITLDREFKVCEKHKIIVQTNKLYSDEHKYVQKIKAKFPDYQFFDTWEQAYKYVFEKGVCDGF